MSWIVEVDEDGMFNFPDELLNQLGWKEGDVVEWVDNHDGSFMLRKYKWECSTRSDAPTTSDQDT